jgi:hypothetical protein
MTVVQVLNTKGAARRLGCSETWIHKLVAAGKLKAYAYDEEGVLMERMSDQKRQGQGLYFFAEEVDTYQPEVQRRPRGSKNKQIRPEARGAKTA